MKQQSKFSGFILIGIGLFFFAMQMNIEIIQPYLTWPTLILIIGLALLMQAGSGKDASHLFSGVFLTGLGIHFHALGKIPSWPEPLQMITLLTGIAFLIQYKKGKDGLLPGLLLTGLSLWLIFFNQNTPSVENIFAEAKNFWPIILMVLGAYFIFFKKK
ncbi:LiaI-LiaF-like domain-containing protein [Fictibacillus phosphorivorans]|uniref:LiaI-LiaF-like domain-containing protein n=1 Tax=Fictibacillus phosphorivorans TaxID=1221500 RepID=UPI00203BD19E|nr:DUF5668 domain-containing protein [Fictibacillus phosphorivorans]MCM3717030.1 hypothetical protein [Fictibacillus phosphorivorans]MCM3774421.1 hypothetical protein [Fictibacillus phosphorivorans]